MFVDYLIKKDIFLNFLHLFFNLIFLNFLKLFFIFFEKLLN
uniref:Uncharacterized protein n=1 Tax=viral metagenome TaxID=1070528 RepID=A0A6C0ADR8_9ZZZZ